MIQAEKTDARAQNTTTAKNRARGVFITFEGIDGAGKSTHIHGLVEFLRQHGKTVVHTREPGGTPLGEKLRELLLHDVMHLETEALLMFAARREHLAQVIAPALQAGQWVVCDRFSDATFAYQGGGRGLAIEKLNALEHWVQQDLQPDTTFLFDLSPEQAQQRLVQARVPDKFEQESLAFFSRVRAEYVRRAEQAPQRFVRIDASQSVSVTADLMRTLALQLLIDY